ncbi:MAG: 3-oxoacyl-ACP reductase [Sulfobacillus thermosulfidooxidans]|nr:MAG: 3-oxoacyl-ACP reductase [Sulfobacillus thermosulfidooxidans]
MSTPKHNPTGDVKMARIVVITGGNRGLGQALVTKFSLQGDHVAVLDIAPTPDDETQQMLEGHQGQYLPCDVRDRLAVEVAIQHITETMGPIDVLVNNVGALHVAEFMQMTDDEWQRMFDVNVKGLFTVTQRVARDMIAREQGTIVNIASMSGKMAIPGQSAYGAAKAAVIHLTKVLALELGVYHIRVNSVCPGILFTDVGHRNMVQLSARKDWKERSAVKRLGTPDDVAEVVAFLASPAAGYMTGQAINVTGGMVMD